MPTIILLYANYFLLLVFACQWLFANSAPIITTVPCNKTTLAIEFSSISPEIRQFLEICTDPAKNVSPIKPLCDLYNSSVISALCAVNAAAAGDQPVKSAFQNYHKCWLTDAEQQPTRRKQAITNFCTNINQTNFHTLLTRLIQPYGNSSATNSVVLSAQNCTALCNSLDDASNFCESLDKLFGFVGLVTKNNKILPIGAIAVPYEAYGINLTCLSNNTKPDVAKLPTVRPGAELALNQQAPQKADEGVIQLTPPLLPEKVVIDLVKSGTQSMVAAAAGNNGAGRDQHKNPIPKVEDFDKKAATPVELPKINVDGPDAVNSVGAPPVVQHKDFGGVETDKIDTELKVPPVDDGKKVIPAAPAADLHATEKSRINSPIARPPPANVNSLDTPPRAEPAPAAVPVAASLSSDSEDEDPIITPSPPLPQKAPILKPNTYVVANAQNRDNDDYDDDTHASSNNPSSGGFFTWKTTILLLSIVALYFGFHYRKILLALLLEGTRPGRGGGFRRRHVSASTNTPRSGDEKRESSHVRYSRLRDA